MISFWDPPNSFKSSLVCISVVQLKVFNQDVILYQGIELLEIQVYYVSCHFLLTKLVKNASNISVLNANI